MNDERYGRLEGDTRDERMPSASGDGSVSSGIDAEGLVLGGI